MKPFLIASILTLISVSCGKKPAPPSSTNEDASAKRADAARRYDRQHDAAMEEATHGTIPEPRPAGPLK